MQSKQNFDFVSPWQQRPISSFRNSDMLVREILDQSEELQQLVQVTFTSYSNKQSCGSSYTTRKSGSYTTREWLLHNREWLLHNPRVAPTSS
ncbi:hypothetical protein CEXT_338951 [Caerostris extrusa]|uniref:Uncharacterized protein n=1 Tax=Caerostris extrusa TaxID=172846 RepID=A0AAV4QU35_CAEEX|nr:hypothetical protein CEXT_338951 [Caerostris extrusa]